jgi:hypothetical protein
MGGMEEDRWRKVEYSERGSAERSRRGPTERGRGLLKIFYVDRWRGAKETR